MGVQETIDGIAAQLSAVSGQLSRGLEEVRGKIADLEALSNAGESVDFSAVNAALAAVSDQAQALDSIVPDAVAEVVAEVVAEDVPVEVVTEDVAAEEVPTENV